MSWVRPPVTGAGMGTQTRNGHARGFSGRLPTFHPNNLTIPSTEPLGLFLFVDIRSTLARIFAGRLC